MANLLAQGDLWQDLNGAAPPSYWDGSAYVWDSATNLYFFIEMTGSLEAGDTFQATVDYVYQGDVEPGFLNYLGTDRVFVESYPLVGGAGQLQINVDAQQGGQFIVTTDPVGRFPDQMSAGSFIMKPGAPVPPVPAISYNCECDDDYPRTTLAEMRKRLLRRLGFAAQATNPPPGMADLLDDFIRSAQEFLFREYSTFQRERFYTWDLIPGLRFYDLDANADACTKRLDPRMISWAGISQGDGSWRPLYCGIDPVMYTARGPGIPSHYEIRQCIELWPAPVDATWKLRIKGQFGLMPLEADTDETTVDPEAIFLLAMANAKAHYGQPDAGNYTSQLTKYMRNLIRGAHHTRRYIPGTADPRNAVRPIPVGGWPEDAA